MRSHAASVDGNAAFSSSRIRTYFQYSGSAVGSGVGSSVGSGVAVGASVGSGVAVGASVTASVRSVCKAGSAASIFSGFSEGAKAGSLHASINMHSNAAHTIHVRFIFLYPFPFYEPLILRIIPFPRKKCNDNPPFYATKSCIAAALYYAHEFSSYCHKQQFIHFSNGYTSPICARQRSRMRMTSRVAFCGTKRLSGKPARISSATRSNSFCMPP